MALKTFIKNYKAFIFMLLFNFGLLLFDREWGIKSFSMAGKNIVEMLGVIPPIFILLGLLDVWVERETMIRFMGDKSGWVGVLLAFLLGSAAAGPLYAAFPIAALFMKKGASFRNVLIFVGSWSTTKIPMLLFEASSLGVNFTLLRLAYNIFGIALIAFLTEKLLSRQEKEAIYRSSGNEKRM